METIFTLNVRDQFMLPFLRDHFNVSDSALHHTIRESHKETVAILKAQGVNYSALRSCLTPTSDKNEAAFIFDSSVIESGWYGPKAMGQLLPLLHPQSPHSVLHGDLLGRDQQRIYELLRDSMVLARSFAFRHSSQFFCIYINNLSDSALARVHERLTLYQPYVGYIPATFSSPAKTYLASTLAGAFIKLGSRVIVEDDEDRMEHENYYLSPYSFASSDKNVVSVPAINYSLFLNFKIECPVSEPNEDDAAFSINAISEAIIPLHECEVLLEDGKHGYLKREKSGKLEKAGVINFSRTDLAALIKSKITSNYIYNLTYLAEHDVMKFNIMLEIPRKDGGYPTRLTASLEYIPEVKLVRVITLT